MKKAFVSVLMGNYDVLKQAPKIEGWDSILFSDQIIDDQKGWECHLVSTYLVDPLKMSRHYKWLTHIHLPQYDMICYMDASMTLLREPKSPMWFKHPRRTNIKDEAKQIIKLNKANADDVMDQLAHYQDTGFEDKFGLYQNGFFVRMHDEKTNELCEVVYGTVAGFTHRDQLAMPYALYLTGYKMQNLRTAQESYTYMKITPHL